MFVFFDQVHTVCESSVQSGRLLMLCVVCDLQTGMDVKQAVDAKAALTLGHDMTFRDLSQGAYRMRGIGERTSLASRPARSVAWSCPWMTWLRLLTLMTGKGQTVHIIVTPEVMRLIKQQIKVRAM